MSRHDDVDVGIVGVLSGPPERAREDTLARTLLGVAIGAQVDLDRSDEQILQLCAAILAKIRSSMATPETVKAVQRLQAALQKPSR